jgi:Zn-dependent M32 family carboxypeptidase
VRGRVDELPDDERLRANVRDAIKDFDQEARKSPELAEAEARLESEAFGAWQAARAASDFALFLPKLKEMFELKQEVTSELFFLAATTRLPLFRWHETLRPPF